jgi:hypothetical protein
MVTGMLMHTVWVSGEKHQYGDILETVNTKTWPLNGNSLIFFHFFAETKPTLFFD